ncbi:MAG TPA: undecaprenyl-diphosphatase UppP [Myxococcota bacterium]|nr:undecaprenyl-diphosphatase UppP [Myxococcota bacterium]HRY95313.1 undecaprenyl-diphosphatase UppP [Myxococcota bacterium]
MDPLQAIVLGLVQGLTEYLPISSTAHLRIVPALAGWPDPGAAFSAVVQLGTLLAVVVYFARDLWRLARAFALGLARRRPFAEPDARLAWLLLLGTLPIGLAGLACQDAIEGALRSLWVVSVSLAALALVLALAERVGRRSSALAGLGWGGGLAIGLAQALALVPGVSRSGVTITAGLFAGLTRADAARFSFLLSVPAVAASGLYELLQLVRELPEGVPWLAVGLGTAAAFASGLGAIAFLMRFLARHSTWVFVIYRLVLAAVLVVLLSCGILPP